MIRSIHHLVGSAARVCAVVLVLATWSFALVSCGSEDQGPFDNLTACRSVYDAVAYCHDPQSGYDWCESNYSHADPCDDRDYFDCWAAQAYCDGEYIYGTQGCGINSCSSSL